ncbi:MAG: poly(R)-hydroxyalkanoic acid synthase subunit PhaE [Haloferacaceae archaeon]
MSDSDVRPEDAREWAEFVEEMNESWFDAVEENVEAQARFVESWFDAVDDSWASSPETVTEGMEGYARAYEAWMRAAEEQLQRTADAIEGEEVSPEDFRDIWLNAANRSFKEVMNTSAFAAATGETVGDAMELQERIDAAAEETLHSLGFATEGDVEEVGARLVELERRQHAVEEKLDEVLAALDGEEGT